MSRRAEALSKLINHKCLSKLTSQQIWRDLLPATIETYAHLSVTLRARLTFGW